jgi:hypothetical protein
MEIYKNRYLQTTDSEDRDARKAYEYQTSRGRPRKRGKTERKVKLTSIFDNEQEHRKETHAQEERH